MGGRAAIYARFSSHNQRGESIEIQVEKSRAYCAENDLRVVATYCDFAQTGTNTDRAEFQRMMADAKRGLFDFVVIYKVTRIMRNRDEMAMARIMLRRCRVEILYAGEDISDGSAGVLQLGMLEVLAEYESALDGERIRDGIQKNAERCMANGCVRYGWDIVDGRYVVNEEEAAAIRLGVRMVLSGKSVADVVRAWEPYRTKRGGKWRFQTVRRILMRRENGGEYRYAGVVVPGGMPAIVPMDDEERVIRMLEDSHRPRAKTEAWDFPLTGKLYDGRDGGLMTGTSGTGKSGRPYHYYRCRSCGRTVRRDVVEKRVADAVREALGSADSRERIARMLADAEEERADEKPLSETVKGELAKIETAFSNIWAAIESGIAPPGGKERIDALKQRQALLKDELRTAEALEAARLDYDRALFWLEGMAAAEVDDAQLLRTFVARVVLGGPDDDDGLRVAFTFDDSAGLGDNPSLLGDHAELTGDYAAIPREMSEVAAAFGKTVLREVDEAEFLKSIPSLRRQCGDRAVLRSMHFFAENRRAVAEKEALEKGNFEKFRQLVIASGRSSAMYLQNVYTGVNPEKQDMSVALALAESILDGRGAVRVHGGGFAGTIQAFVPNDMLSYFKTTMESVLGKDACHVLTIRPAGGVVLLA